MSLAVELTKNDTIKQAARLHLADRAYEYLAARDQTAKLGNITKNIAIPGVTQRLVGRIMREDSKRFERIDRRWTSAIRLLGSGRPMERILADILTAYGRCAPVSLLASEMAGAMGRTQEYHESAVLRFIAAKDKFFDLGDGTYGLASWLLRVDGRDEEDIVFDNFMNLDEVREYMESSPVVKWDIDALGDGAVEAVTACSSGIPLRTLALAAWRVLGEDFDDLEFYQAVASDSRLLILSDQNVYLRSFLPKIENAIAEMAKEADQMPAEAGEEEAGEAITITETDKEEIVAQILEKGDISSEELLESVLEVTPGEATYAGALENLRQALADEDCVMPLGDRWSKVVIVAERDKEKIIAMITSKGSASSEQLLDSVMRVKPGEAAYVGALKSLKVALAGDVRVALVGADAWSKVVKVTEADKEDIIAEILAKKMVSSEDLLGSVMDVTSDEPAYAGALESLNQVLAGDERVMPVGETGWSKVVKVTEANKGKIVAKILAKKSVTSEYLLGLVMAVTPSEPAYAGALESLNQILAGDERVMPVGETGWSKVVKVTEADKEKIVAEILVKSSASAEELLESMFSVKPVEAAYAGALDSLNQVLVGDERVMSVDGTSWSKVVKVTDSDKEKIVAVILTKNLVSAEELLESVLSVKPIEAAYTGALESLNQVLAGDERVMSVDGTSWSKVVKVTDSDKEKIVAEILSKNSASAEELLESVLAVKPIEAAYAGALDSLKEALADDDRIMWIGGTRWSKIVTFPEEVHSIPDSLTIPLVLPFETPEGDVYDQLLEEEGLEGDLKVVIYDPLAEDVLDEDSARTIGQIGGDSQRCVLKYHHKQAGTFPLCQISPDFFGYEPELIPIEVVGGDVHFTAYVNNSTRLIYGLAKFYAGITEVSGAVFYLEKTPNPGEYAIRYEGELDGQLSIDTNRVLELLDLKAKFESQVMPVYDVLRDILEKQGMPFAKLVTEVNIVRRCSRLLIASLLSSYHCFSARGKTGIWQYDAKKESQGFNKNKRKYIKKG